jgi:hypothetical protein
MRPSSDPTSRSHDRRWAPSAEASSRLQVKHERAGLEGSPASTWGRGATERYSISVSLNVTPRARETTQ